MGKKKIRKVVIPAAGYGTRFLPATKAQPKEMLPIVDKPIIQYVVEEAVQSGIEDIIIVTGWQKRSIEDHFDYPFELEKRLEKAGKLKELEEVRHIAEMANFIYVRQKGPYGNGTPVLSAKHVVGDEPFAVLWGDEFIAAEPPRLKQLIDAYEEFGGSVVSAITIDNRRELSKYGIADGTEIRDHLWKLKQIVEKPKPEDAPSNVAAHGGYVFSPSIFSILAKTKPGRDNEIWLVDAINTLIKTEDVHAVEMQNARYYDTGNKLEYLKANIEFALLRQELGEDLRNYLKKLVQGL